MRFAFLAGCLLIAAYANAEEAAPWAGKWASTEQACSDEGGLSIVLSADTFDLSIFEAVCSVRDVNQSGGEFLFLLDCNGEGGKHSVALTAQLTQNKLRFTKQAGLFFLQKIFYRCATKSTEVAPTKILLGPHTGDATILTLSGVNTDRAIATFRRELDDFIEYCNRNFPPDDNGVVDAKRIAKCLKELTTEESGRIYKRRAYCSRLTVYTEFGNYSLVGQQKEEEQRRENGKMYRPIQTDWKDHRTGKVVGNCSACGSQVLLDILKVLCPAEYKKHFDGYDPY